MGGDKIDIKEIISQIEAFLEQKGRSELIVDKILLTNIDSNDRVTEFNESVSEPITFGCYIDPDTGEVTGDCS